MRRAAKRRKNKILGCVVRARKRRCAAGTRGEKANGVKFYADMYSAIQDNIRTHKIKSPAHTFVRGCCIYLRRNTRQSLPELL